MFKVLLCTTTFILLLSISPYAGENIFVYDSGNDLFESMKDGYGSPKKNYAMGYVIGVTDTLQGIVLNINPGVTKIQIFDVVFNYLKENPQERHENARTIVLKSLIKAFGKKGS
ncbi:hypothetical protein K9F62_20830 [Desulfovibrio sp. JY]|nr:hypothetical protein K9F62_20830 [Desulfovibrio sp. JY]